LKANQKPNSDEPESRQSRTLSPFDHPTNMKELACENGRKSGKRRSKQWEKNLIFSVKKTLIAAVKTLIVAVTKYPLRFSSLGFHRNSFAPVFPALKGCNHSTEAFNFPHNNVLTCAQGLEPFQYQTLFSKNSS